jgi:hypothetical protein
VKSIALTLGAGVQWHEAYDAAEKNSRIVVGGISAGGSVGAAGGWVMGGGHSALSSTHGLGKFTVTIVFLMLSVLSQALTM